MPRVDPIKLYRQFRRHFYDGPALFNFPGRKIKGYRSPNLLISWWIRAFMFRHFTMVGGGLLVLTGIFLLIGMTSTLMPVYLLAFALLSLFIIDFAVGFIFRPTIRIMRSSPASAPAHTPIRIEYHVENLRRRAAWNLYVDMVPPPTGMVRPHGYPFVASLPGKEGCRITGYVQADRRGEYQLAQPLADSSFPFGLWRWGSSGDTTSPIMIFPDYTLLESIALPIGQRYQMGQMVQISHSGGSMEFYGCREFRYGDNPRRIHAPSWARLRQPIVKEFREEYMARVAIILDTTPHPRPLWVRALHRTNNQFEAGISMTAAVVEYMVRMDYRIDFFALGVPPLRGGGGRGQSYLQTVLELLASLHESEGAFPGMPEDLLREIGEISAAVMVLLDWDDERAAMVDALRDAGIATRVLVVADKPVDGLPPATVSMLLTRQVLDGQVTRI